MPASLIDFPTRSAAAASDSFAIMAYVSSLSSMSCTAMHCVSFIVKAKRTANPDWKDPLA